MKTEISNENKLKFFSQYLGQSVWGNSFYKNCTVNFESLHPIHIESKAYLTLKSLSNMSDEDAVKIFGFMYPNCLPGVGEFEKIETVKSIFDSEFRQHKFLDLKESSAFIDVAKSLGYALPFMGISVAEMVVAGWVKLK